MNSALRSDRLIISILCTLFGLLALASSARGSVTSPTNTAFTFDISLFDGAAMVTGATVTGSIQRDSDGQYWTGSAWSASYSTVNLTERTGNVSLEGRYYYTLSSTAISTTPNTFRFSSKYSSGGTLIYNRETLTTYAYTGSDGRVLVSADAHSSALTISTVSTVDEVTGNIGGNVEGDVLGKIIGSGSGVFSGLGVQSDLTSAVLAKFATTDTGESSPASGSVAALAQGSGGDPSSIADAVWAEALSTYTSSGTAGYSLRLAHAKLNAVNVTIQSPVASDGTLEIVQGDDYAGDSALSISRTWTGANLTGGTAVFSVMPYASYIAGTGSATLANVSCTFTGGTSGSTVVTTIPLTAAQTAALTPSPAEDPLNYVYQIVFTTTGGKKHTLFRGTMTVVRSVE